MLCANFVEKLLVPDRVLNYLLPPFNILLFPYLVTVLLLFLPEESKNFEIVTVDRNLDYVVDIDEIYNYQSFSSSQIILEVTLEGSFIGKTYAHFDQSFKKKLEKSFYWIDFGSIFFFSILNSLRIYLFGPQETQCSS